MRYLYIFPHPDDESFGPAPGIAKQLSEGHQVYLLTLTRGGATRQRHRYGYSVEQMGEVRLVEMQAVEKLLGLTGMTVLDFPDSGLKEVAPQELENAVAEHIKSVQPDILVTYPVHGISGFHDHLVTHAVVKRVYTELRLTAKTVPGRLAFYTVKAKEDSELPGKSRLHTSTEEEIDCVVETSPENINFGQQALDCYETYQETIDKTGIREKIKEPLCFELFQETFDPPLCDLAESIK